jgi:hypothetical protein
MAVSRPSVLKWAPVVEAELSRAQVPLPRDLILSVIDVESRGKAGLVNLVSGASGLMQVMPGTLASYNQSNPPVSLSELRSSSPAAGVKQIRVGLWVVATYWRGAYNYLSDRLAQVPIDELAHIADLYYVAGPEATRKRLDKLGSPTWAGVQARFPNWNALPHPRNVFKRLEGLKWPIEAISSWLETKSIMKPGPREGFALAVLGILVAWYFLRKKGKDSDKKER